VYQQMFLFKVASSIKQKDASVPGQFARESFQSRP